MTKINVVKKRASNPTMALIGLTLFVLMIIWLGQNQLFFNLRPYDSLVNSTPHAISDHNNRRVEKSKSIINCERSHYFYDICSINGPTIFDPFESTFYDMDSTNKNIEANIIVQKIKPYPRKWEKFTMGQIKEFTLTTSPIGPPCLIHHKAQALVFSVGGYTGNFFHDINDGFIPLFITVNSLIPNQDFILVISKLEDWWVQKYKDLLQSFSKYPIIDIDKEINVTHCFPRATLGLMSHGFMNIDPKLTPTSKTLIDFHNFLATTYGTGQSQPHQSQLQPQPQSQTRPRLVLASRDGSVGRLILNQDEVRLIAEQIGFEVILFKPRKNTSLHESFELIHSSHAMIGVHGAALTHALFLRPSSIFIQIVPIGAEGVSDICFGKLARDMNLVYEEYKIGVEESSLMEKFGKENSLVLKNPKALQGKGFARDEPLPQQYEFMQMVDLYADKEPWKIFEATNSHNSSTRYFITPIKKVKAEHKRALRTVGNGGTWRVQNKGKEVFDDKGRLMGYVKSFKYTPHDKNNFVNGEWLMTEYSLHDNYVGARNIKKKGFAICKIKKKERSSTDKKKLSVNDEDIEEFINSVLPQDEENNIEYLEGDELEEHVFAALEDDSDPDIDLDAIDFI